MKKLLFVLCFMFVSVFLLPKMVVGNLHHQHVVDETKPKMDSMSVVGVTMRDTLVISFPKTFESAERWLDSIHKRPLVL